MVAPRKIRRVVCTVIRVPANDPFDMFDDNRPSNRLPWSDPTIARLVANLQDEVRFERRQAKLDWRTSNAAVADIDPPSPESESPVHDNDWEWHEDPRWSWPQ
jgi:hypothetical protein